MAWSTNVTATASLARIAASYGITLVHISSDYVFDGRRTDSYGEDDPVSPLGVYGQTKAAGEKLVEAVPRCYVIRTSWVVGEGNNFIRTMLSLAKRGINPKVVDDQRGRLTFADDLARAIQHLIEVRAPYGIYNVTSCGDVTTWAEIARQVFFLAGHDPTRVTGVTTEQYYLANRGPVAPRPLNSALSLGKIRATGFIPVSMNEALATYVERQVDKPPGLAGIRG